MAVPKYPIGDHDIAGKNVLHVLDPGISIEPAKGFPEEPHYLLSHVARKVGDVDVG